MGLSLSKAKQLFPPETYEIINKKYHRAAASGFSSDVECSVGDGMARSQKGARYSTPVSIRIYSVRKRLADADGISAKAAIDGLRHSGILSDDTTAWINEIRYSQEKCQKDQDEITIITIKPMEGA